MADTRKDVQHQWSLLRLKTTTQHLTPVRMTVVRGYKEQEEEEELSELYNPLASAHSLAIEND